MKDLELPPPASLQEFRRRVREERRERQRESADRRVRLWGRRISDVGGWCYRGTVRAFQFPAYVFDLLDRYGKPDHSKIGPFLVSQELVALLAYDVVVNHRPLQAAIVLIVAVLSFASMSLMRKFLDKTSTQIVSSTSIEDKRTTVTGRFTAEGIPAFSNPAVPGAQTVGGEQ